MATALSFAAGISPEIDVFTLPHCKMRQLIVNTTEEVTSTDFGNTASMQTLLQQLNLTLIQFRLHEEIEDKYIMRVLKKRLTGGMLKKLLKHLHANSHISELISFVKSLQKEIILTTPENTLKKYGQKLNDALNKFYREYLPHMVDEEKVFQPLLLEYFSYNELRRIKDRVLKLHSLQDDESSSILHDIPDIFASLGLSESKEEADEPTEIPTLTVPAEILLKIFSYLQPKEICRCAQVSKLWSSVAMNQKLWSILHPSRWGCGEVTFGRRTSSDDCNCDCEPNYKLMPFREELEEMPSSGSDSDDVDDEHQREAKILSGITGHLLPKVGKGVKTLVFECSKAITNGRLHRILSQCPNLEYLDVSQTIISDLGINGLFNDGGGRNLKYLDVSGCTGITDKTLQKLSSFYGKASKAERKDSDRCADCNCTRKPEQQIRKNSNETHKKRFPAKLECLRLSGCYKITDDGLRSLTRIGLPNLRHLDLSGCLNVSARSLTNLVHTCPHLDAQELFYCDNILEGPFADSASGCQNVYCKNRVCCRSADGQ